MPYSQPPFTRIIPGNFLYANLPTASLNTGWLAWTTDMASGTYCVSDGVKWKMLDAKRYETYSGTTDSSGNFTVVYPTPYTAVPTVIPVISVATDGLTKLRVSVSSVTGFTVKAESNSLVTVLTISVIAGGLQNAVGVPVKAFVIE